MAVLSQINFAK